MAMKPPSSLEEVSWQNENPVCALLSRLVIDYDSSRMAVYEACGKGECSWGWTPLDSIETGYMAQYQEGDFRYELYLVPVNPDQIQLLITAGLADEPSTFLSQANFHREK